MRFNLPFQDKPFDVVGMGLNSVDFLAVVPQQAVAQTDFLLRSRLPRDMTGNVT